MQSIVYLEKSYAVEFNSVSKRGYDISCYWTKYSYLRHLLLDAKRK